MRKNGTLTYILGDHLGSTSLVTDANGAVINQTKYKAWGETRYSSGTEQTKYQYTGQYSYASDFGLHFYNARWYDSSLGRFAQADTIVPLQTQGVQAWDRYAYVNNNPVLHTDPSGHCVGPAIAYVICAIVVVTVLVVSAVNDGGQSQRDDLPPEAPQLDYYVSPTPTITYDPNYELPTVDLPSIGVDYPTQPPMDYPPTYSYNAPNSISTPTPCSTVIPTANCIPTSTNTNTNTPTLSATTTSTSTSTSTSTITSTSTYVPPATAMNTQTNTPIIPTPTYYPTPRATPTLIPY